MKFSTACLWCGVASELAANTNREMNLILVSRICYIFQKIQMLGVWNTAANWNEKLYLLKADFKWP